MNLDELDRALEAEGVEYTLTQNERSFEVEFPGRYSFDSIWWLGGIIEKAVPDSRITGISWGQQRLAFSFEERRVGGSLGWVGMPEYA